MLSPSPHIFPDTPTLRSHGAHPRRKLGVVRILRKQVGAHQKNVGWVFPFSGGNPAAGKINNHFHSFRCGHQTINGWKSLQNRFGAITQDNQEFATPIQKGSA